MTGKTLWSLAVAALAVSACGDIKRGIPLKTPPPDDSYEQYTLVETYNNCETGDEGCAYARAVFPQFSTQDAAFLNPLILAAVAHPELRPEAVESASADTISARFKRFLTGYATFKEDFPDDAQVWFKDISVAPNRPFSGWVTLALTLVEHEGGAHPNEKTVFLNYELSNQRLISLQEVMVPGFENALNEKLEAAFRADKKLAPTDSLKKAGLFEETWKLPSQFVLTHQGIRFYYNRYEIGPRAIGPIDILLDWQALKGLSTLQIIGA
jgi:hypothetical protein